MYKAVKTSSQSALRFNLLIPFNRHYITVTPKHLPLVWLIKVLSSQLRRYEPLESPFGYNGSREIILWALKWLYLVLRIMPLDSAEAEILTYQD